GGVHEQGTGFALREGGPGGGAAGIHAPRPGPAMGLRIAAHRLELDELPVEVEIVAVRPDQLDDVDPFLRVVVADSVLALLDAEHLELVLVPADDDVEAEAALADVIGGAHLLGGEDRGKP